MDIKTYISVTWGIVFEVFKANKGAIFHLFLLWDMYQSLVKHFMYEVVDKLYMSHLVGCIILTNKYRV